MIEYKIKDFCSDVAKLAKMIQDNPPSFHQYDGIYPIPRGGVPVAIELSKLLAIPILENITFQTLIVDDIADSGQTIAPFLRTHCDVAVLHIRDRLSPDFTPTYFVKEIDDWIHYWWEGKNETASIENNITRIIQYIGDNPDRIGLKDTPKRVAKMYKEFFAGYDPSRMPNLTVFPNGQDGVQYDEMLRDQGYFFSFCEHHIVPFFGEYYFAYIPDKLILGASKIARLVDYYAGRLQIAERLTHDIAGHLEKILQPKGLILIMKARHLCKEMRGVKKWDSPYEAIAVRGCFLENKNNCKMEFLARLPR